MIAGGQHTILLSLSDRRVSIACWTRRGTVLVTLDNQGGSLKSEAERPIG